MMKTLASVTVAMLSLVAGAIEVSSSTTSTPGVWNSNFGTSKAYAEQNNIPMLIFWGSSGCSKCSALKAAVANSDFTTWQSQRKLVMVYVLGTGSSDAIACKAFVKNPSLDFPYMGVYWKKSDGTTVKQLFTGRSSTMPVSGSTLQGTLMNSVDRYIVGWDPSGAPVPPTPTPPDGEDPGSVVIGPEWDKARKLTAAVLDSDDEIVGNVEFSTGRKNRSEISRVSAKASVIGFKKANFPSARIEVSTCNRLAFSRPGKNITADISKPAAITGTLVLDGKRFTISSAAMGGKRDQALKFYLIGVPATIDDKPVVQSLLPTESAPQTFEHVQKRWTFPRTKTPVYDEATRTYSSESNPSRLKLTYKYANGYFKGTVYINTESKPGRLKRQKGSVEGYFSQSKGGYGTVTVRNVGTYKCRVETVVQ